MNATAFKPGDRVKLVRMYDEFRGDCAGHIGTVISACPPPVNTLNVDWDDGFSLNPCLDVDIVEIIP